MNLGLIQTYLSAVYIASRLLFISFFSNKKTIVLTEHLGDIIACSSIPEEIYLKECTKVNWVVNKKYADVLMNNPFINNVIKIPNLGTWAIAERILSKSIRLSKNIYNLHFSGRECDQTKLRLMDRLSFHNGYNCEINSDNYYRYGCLIQVFSQIGGLGKISRSPKLYFSKKTNFGELGRYVVVHTTSNERSRNWNDQGWNSLAKYVIENTNLNIVEIGFNNTINFSNDRYINMTGYLKFNDIYSLIDQSIWFIGIDSSFAHIANSLEKKSVIILGNYRGFKNYMPYSGYFSNNEFKTLFRFDGELNNLTFSNLKPFLLLNND